MRTTDTNASAATDDALAVMIAQALRGMRFGSVEVVVHDGRVVQFERRERHRFDRPPETGAR